MQEKNFGALLSKRRIEKGYSQEKLAELLGVSRQAVTKWESNLSRPSSDNLMTLGEILDISVDELLERERNNEADAEPKREDSKKVFVFMAVSLACLVAYPIISGIRGCFSIGIMILLFVMTIPCQLFVHFVFSSAVKSNDFSMIAGYDRKVRYNVAEYKKALMAIDVTTYCSEAVYGFVICVVGCVGVGQDYLIPLILFLYILSFMGNIFVINYRYADRLFQDEADCARCKKSLPIDALFISEILFNTGALFWAVIRNNAENNTPSALILCGIMFIGIIAALVGLLVEEKRLKKWEPANGTYRMSVCAVICAVICLATIVIMLI